MSAWILEAPGKPGSARRLAWLEAEYSRLGFECQYLEAVNGSINRRIEGVDEDAVELPDEDDNVVSPDMIDLDTEPSPDPSKHAAMGQNSLTLSDFSGQKGERDGSLQTEWAEKRPQTKAGRRASRVSYRPDAEDHANDLSHFDSNTSLGTGMDKARSALTLMGNYTNAAVMKGSALGRSRPVQALIYLVAFAGVIFVLIATATHLGVPDHHGDGHGDDHGAGHGDDHGAAAADGGHGAADEHHRRLGGAAPALLKNIAFSLVGAGLVGYLMQILKQPLIIGYLLGGVLVGPIGLGIVTGYTEIDEIAELGLLFLLFMIGMELDFHKLFKMDRVVLVAGFFQFPICAGAMYVFLSFLKEVAGLTLGSGTHPVLYISLTCSVSSTMVVTKMLAEKFETDSPAGRLTNGILMCQDLWAIVILAIQPTLDEPTVGQILKNFVMIAILIVVALAYAKFVMPPVLLTASKSVELMLVLALSWCFFICSAAILPFVGLSMELAAIIAGCALATFPYSQDFNGKIKYIRDFFITLFFAGVGMQVPTPALREVGEAALVAGAALAIRWLGTFALIWAVGGEPRVAALSTINLSQISEFAIVICSMGISDGGGFGHIQGHTMTIIIWAFAILAVLNCVAFRMSHQIVRAGASVLRSGLLFRRAALQRQERGEEDEDEDEDDEDAVYQENHRDIVLLGFHKVAAMLIAEFQMHSPEILKRIHIIDINPSAMSSLREKGIKCSWGDFASAKELARRHKGECNVVISSIPDSLLQGVSNMKLLKVSREVWPQTHFIATADNPFQAQNLYEAGADYVVRMAKLCAERLHELLAEHCSRAFGSGELTEIFSKYKVRDKDHKSKKGFLSLKV